MEARPAVEKQIETLMQQTRGNLLTGRQQMRFDGSSRRFRAITNAQVGNYATQQEKAWAVGTHKASAKLAMEEISMKPDDTDAVGNGASNLISAYVKIAEMDGAQPGDPMYEEAVQRGKRDAFAVQLDAIAVEDPARAMRMLQQNKGTAGTLYDNLYNRFRVRADQQTGTATADRLVGSGAPLLDGGSSQAVLRQFEGFRNTAYWDQNHWRTGYGSDTVTRADGRVEKVTENTVVTKEDAERDLERRTAISQHQVRDAIGPKAWDALDDRAKASLSSIAYNYGSMSKPELQGVVEAAKSGDKERLAAAVLGLSSHNGGINARRRATEAANIQGKNGPGERPSLQNQAEILEQIDRDPSLSPQAKAAATAEVNKRYAASRNHQVKTEVQFKERVDNSLSEAVTLGAPTDPIPENDFLKHYGDVQGPVNYRAYISNVRYGADYKAMDGMSDAEQDQLINSREKMIQPGSPSFAADQANITRLRAGAEKIKAQRTNDPAGAVSRTEPVVEAMKQYDPKAPETFITVANTRMAEQRRLGIPEDAQSPITKTEALTESRPVQLALPGQKMDALEKMGVRFRTMYGDNADKAFLYALKAMKIQGDTAAQYEGIFKSLADGKPITEAERRDAREKAMGAEIEAALAKTAAPGSMPAWMTQQSVGGEMAGFQGPADPTSPGGRRPTPNGAAIKDLRDNPSTAAEFDKVYGSGTAKKLMETYPLYFKKSR